MGLIVVSFFGSKWFFGIIFAIDEGSCDTFFTAILYDVENE